jgi:hypothetical protein
MVASGIDALSHPMTSMSEEIFSLSIWIEIRAAAKLDSGSAHEINNDRNEKNRSEESAANHHVDLLS